MSDTTTRPEPVPAEEAQSPIARLERERDSYRKLYREYVSLTIQMEKELEEARAEVKRLRGRVTLDDLPALAEPDGDDPEPCI
jgi:hypothetical protein